MRQRTEGMAAGTATEVAAPAGWKMIAAIACVLALAGSVPPAFAETGQQDFEQYCADCHGVKANGKGTSKLLPQHPPPDLTLLAKQNGGTFPFARVVSIIDGREAIPSHARIEMPFWGVTLQQPGKEFTPQSDARVKARIDAMARYIETLQVK
jgi:mono/diheme cytochrome c family protein